MTKNDRNAYRDMLSNIKISEGIKLIEKDDGIELYCPGTNEIIPLKIDESCVDGANWIISLLQAGWIKLKGC
jgi:hypothetical protein